MDSFKFESLRHPGRKGLSCPCPFSLLYTLSLGRFFLDVLLIFPLTLFLHLLFGDRDSEESPKYDFVINISTLVSLFQGHNSSVFSRVFNPTGKAT